MAAGLKAKTTPEAFVLDGGGMVRYRGRIDDAYSARLKRNPIITSNDLVDALAAVVAGKPVARPVTTPVGCTIDLEPAAVARSGAATFHKDVAPILNNHCVVCHRPGEVGPFALTTYKQARRWAADIKEYTRNRQMPPWMPTGGVAMHGERKLTDKEIATLAAWADAGTPEGDPKDAPPAPDFGRRLAARQARPDPHRPARTSSSAPVGDDLFRVFVVPTGLTENKWVIGYDVRPGNPRVVHHTLHFFDTTGQARGLEKKQLEQDQARHRERQDHGRSRAGLHRRHGRRVLRAPAASAMHPPSAVSAAGRPGNAPQFVPRAWAGSCPRGPTSSSRRTTTATASPRATARRSASTSPRSRSTSRGRRSSSTA